MNKIANKEANKTNMSKIKDEEAKDRATERTNALTLSHKHINTSDRTDVRSSREIEKG